MSTQVRFPVAQRVDDPHAHAAGRLQGPAEQIDFIVHDSRRLRCGAIVGRDRRGATALATRITQAATRAEIPADYITAGTTSLRPVAELATHLWVGKTQATAARHYLRRSRTVGGRKPTLLIVDDPAAVFATSPTTWDSLLASAALCDLSLLILADSLAAASWGGARPRDLLTRDQMFHLRDEPTHGPHADAEPHPPSLQTLPEPGRFSYGFFLAPTHRLTTFAVDTEQA